MHARPFAGSHISSHRWSEQTTQSVSEFLRSLHLTAQRVKRLKGTCQKTRLVRYRYDAKADLWSVGTIFFELLTGRPPFSGANYLDLTRNILSREAAIPPQVRPCWHLAPCSQVLQAGSDAMTCCFHIMLPEICRQAILPIHDSRSPCQAVGSLFQTCCQAVFVTMSVVCNTWRECQVWASSAINWVYMQLSTPCKELLRGLLRRNPVERISFEEFFSHSFLTGVSTVPAPPATDQPVWSGPHVPSADAWRTGPGRSAPAAPCCTFCFEAQLGAFTFVLVWLIVLLLPLSWASGRWGMHKRDSAGPSCIPCLSS